MDEALFEEYVWPYMMITDIPKEIGKVNVSSLIKFFAVVYVLIVLTLAIVCFIKIKQAKR